MSFMEKGERKTYFLTKDKKGTRPNLNSSKEDSLESGRTLADRTADDAHYTKDARTVRREVWESSRTAECRPVMRGGSERSCSAVRSDDRQ
jgi:hypothetical protein